MFLGEAFVLEPWLRDLEALPVCSVRPGLWLCCRLAGDPWHGAGRGALGTRSSWAGCPGDPGSPADPLPRALGALAPKPDVGEGNLSCLLFRYFLLKGFVSFKNFQIALVSVPIAHVSAPPAPHRQRQGK